MMISRNRKSLALLLDPDKTCGKKLDTVIGAAVSAGVDLIMAGGSLTFRPIEMLIDDIKTRCEIPVALFPGNLLQLTDKADYIFLLSLISGRNPELLIGNHVIAAPFLSNIRHKVIPVGYILIGIGSETSVTYMSQTEPIPASKPEITVATAIAGELLGMKLIYLEAGSGAKTAVSPATISDVRRSTNLPLITGGGLRSVEAISKAYNAGADMVVVGNGVEDNPGLLIEACLTRNSFNAD
ncbi:MAG: phosphoglycerol geranylgeranyltransferase [Bacteroidales bacterium]